MTLGHDNQPDAGPPYRANVARRADPERIYQARRHAARSRLRGQGVPENRAEAWIAAWEDSPGARSLDRFTAAYWDACEAWVTERRTTRREPPDKASA